MPVPIGYGLYVLGNIVVRAIIKTQGKIRPWGHRT
jgi:hypothetical protein